MPDAPVNPAAVPSPVEPPPARDLTAEEVTRAARWVSLGILFAFMVVLGVMFFQIITPFILPLFLASVLAILLQPIHNRFLVWTQQRHEWAAALTTLLALLVVLIPILAGTLMSAAQLVTLTQDELEAKALQNAVRDVWPHIIEPAIDAVSPYVPGGLDAHQLQQQMLANTQALAGQMASRTFSLMASTVGSLVAILVALGVFLVALFYFLADGPRLIETIQTLVPVQKQHQQQLFEQFATAVRGVVLATLLAAMAQGLATAVGAWFAGVGGFFIILVIATIAALIPLFGTGLIWWPCVLWLGIKGHWGAATGLAVYGLFVVSLLDNVVRTYVLNSDMKMHPLLAFVSVLGALQVMGLWGVFIGPIVASCLSAMTLIFHKELTYLVPIEQKRTPLKTGTSQQTLPIVVESATGPK